MTKLRDYGDAAGARSAASVEQALADHARAGRSSTERLTVHPRLERLFAALEAAELRWCLIRGAADLAMRSGGDVDLLVAPADLPGLCEVAGECGLTAIPAWGYGTHRFFLGYDRSEDLWLKLDIVTELAFGHGYTLRTHAEQECLARSDRRNGVAVLADDDAFWALLLHRLLDKRDISPEAATDLQALARVAGTRGPLAAAVARTCPPGWTSDRVLECARDAAWPALLEAGRGLEAEWRRRNRGPVARAAFVNATKRQSGRLLRLWYRPGLAVALLAPDGAGKSTLAAGLADTFHFPVRRVYMGVYQSGPAGRGLVPPPGLGLGARLVRQWARWLGAWLHRSRGRLVLFDRYGYDALLPPRRTLGRLGGLRRWLLAHACPPPDLVVLLDAPGEVLHARKREQSAEVLERERQAYRSLLPRLHEAVAVDATGDADQVRREVLSLVWRVWSRRWTARNGSRRRPDVPAWTRSG